MRRLPAGAALLALLLAALAAPAAAALSPAASALADYLRIDTSNPPGNESAAVAFLEVRLRAAGIASERLTSPAGRTSLLARLPATVPNAPAVVLLHHLDVVPPGEGWTAPPFAGEVREGALVGRGAVDCKSLGIAQLEALLDAARQPVRRRALLYLAVADEENGGGEGMGWLAEKRPELFAGVEAALGEGGLNRSVLGKTWFWGLEVAQKRAYWLELTAHGRPGHASSLNPDSAAHLLIRALARLLDLPPEWRAEAPMVAYLEGLHRYDPPFQRPEVRPREILATGAPAKWFPLPLTGLLQDTIQVTRLVASDRTNVVAAEARAEIDARLLPSTNAEAFLARVRAALGKGIDLRVTLATPQAPSSGTSNAAWRTIAAALAPEAPTIPVMIPGITDARYLRARGIAVYGFSPFELEVSELRRVHAPDEQIPLDVFDRGVERMRRVVRALVAAAP